MRRLPAAAAVVAAALAAAGCTGDGGRGAGTATTRASQQAPPAESSGGLDTGVVARVNDGDTLTLRDGRKVRLLQIDAPELDGDCYGRAARREALRLLPPGTTVTLRRDAALDDRDRYGRYLRYVEANARNANAELVAAGAAVPYFFRGQRGRHAAELMAAVAEARRAKAGLWQACPRARLDTGLGSLTGPA